MRRLERALALFALAGAAIAQPYPAKPIRLVLGYPAGGGADTVVRVFLPGMERALGQPIVIDYRPGAAAMLAAEHVARAAPDGYTLHYVDSAPLTISPVLRKTAYDPQTSFTPISRVVSGGYVLVGHPSVRADTLPALVALARAQPGRISYGSSGTGGSGHLTGELLRSLAAIDIVHIPYKGGAQSMSDLIGGQIDLIFASLPTAVPQVRAGKIKTFGYTATERSRALPEVPTFIEAGVALEASVWFGLVGPAGLAPEIVARVRGVLVGALEPAEVVEAIRKQGYEVTPSTPAALADRIRTELDKWGRVIRSAKIAVD